ncbi:sulfotransferase family protein [Poseidonocella sp. HB161398]|uniref:sulfotransferase family protein n=1 Tax=Poseidonocella sp. HB161398 TaxID=2320855 RepID=UPI001109C09A|nr:sulfotransferase family protein [Poseidonocella sp. HB161398]
MDRTARQPAKKRVPLAGLSARLGVNGRQLDYLVNPDLARGIAYIETPKVACTAIKAYMQSRAGTVPAVVHDRDASPLPRLSALKIADRWATLAGPVRRFGFTRNPFTRVLSGYLDKIVRNEWERPRHLPRLGFAPDARIDFATFLQALAAIPDAERDIHFARQTRLLMIGDVSYDFLGAFERFDADFAEMKRRYYGAPQEDATAGTGRHHATSANSRLAEFFGPREIRLAQEIYALDFALLDYSAELADAAAPPARMAAPERSVRLAARHLGLPDPAADIAGFDAALDAERAAGRLGAERVADLRERAAAGG